MSFDAAAALSLARDRSEELVELLSRLIARPSPYGSSGSAAQDVLAAYLDNRGISPRRRVVDPEAWVTHPEHMPPHPEPPIDGEEAEAPVNLVGEPGSTTVERDTSPAVVLFGHIDTEPPSDGWSGSPWEPALEGNRLRGLGAADAKSGLAAAAVAASESWRRWRLPVRLLSVHGKGGGSRGTLPLFASDSAGTADLAIYVHAAETGRGLAELKHASRGVVDLAVHVEGWRGEPREIGTPASAPFEEGGNAISATCELVRSLRERLPPTCGVNLGRLGGGEGPGTVPLAADARVRVVFDDPLTADVVWNAVGEIVERQSGPSEAGSRGFRIDVETRGMWANPASVDWDGPLCRLLRHATREVTGEDPSPYRGHLASDIRFPVLTAGVPAVGLGPVGGNFYGPDEWVDVDDLVRTTAVLLLALRRIGDRKPVGREANADGEARADGGDTGRPS